MSHVNTSGAGSCIEARCPIRIDHDRGIQIPPEVLNTILQEQPDGCVDWKNAELLIVDKDA